MKVDFEKQSYWHERFSSESAFEWLVSSSEFFSILRPHLDRLGTSSAILQLGFGTSDLHNHLRERGFITVTNVDYEPLAVERGRDLERRKFGDVKMDYAVADVTQLALPTKYDLIVDKSTSDAVSCAGEEALLRMANGARKCLAPGGVWISLSFSSSRFDLDRLPFDVEIIAKIPTPKLKPFDPDVFHWCYLMRPR